MADSTVFNKFDAKGKILTAENKNSVMKQPILTRFMPFILVAIDKIAEINSGRKKHAEISEILPVIAL